MEETIKVYVRLKDDMVVSISSSIFNQNPTEDDILIDEGYGMKCAHAQGNYLDKPITDEEGLHNYKLVNGKVVERTKEEKEVERASIPTIEPQKTIEELDKKVQEQDELITELIGTVIPSIMMMNM